VLFYFSDRSMIGSPQQTATPFAMLQTMHSAAELVASMSQLALNHRQGQFAGQYKLEAVLRGVDTAITVLWQIPLVVGVVAPLPGLTLEDLLHIVICAGFVWQAFTLAKVPKVEDVED
jgi:hypothetical protein